MGGGYGKRWGGDGDGERLGGGVLSRTRTALDEGVDDRRDVDLVGDGCLYECLHDAATVLERRELVDLRNGMQWYATVRNGTQHGI